jgi:lysophospholipase L1-like esterase
MLALLYWLPFLLHCIPATVALGTRSTVPLLLGRYSAFLFAFNAATLVVYAWAFLAWKHRHLMARQGALMLLGALSIGIVGSHNFQYRGWTVLAPTIRLLIAGGMVATAFEQRRAGQPWRSRFFVTLASLALLSATVDIAVSAWMLARAEKWSLVHSTVREEYDLERLAAGDVVIVGDSFVWGEGVPWSSTFGNVLDASLADRGDVYSLGIRGADVPEYVALLRTVPEGKRLGRVILSYCHNDMPAPARPQVRIQQLGFKLGHHSPSLKVFGDLVGKALTPTIDHYLASVIDAYREGDPTFEVRWTLLATHLKEFHELCAARSDEPPIFLLLPLLIDFTDYPLRRSHERLGHLARSLGFEVVDPLPAFERLGVDARNLWASPDDAHFGQRAHALTAEVLEAVLERHDDQAQQRVLDGE